ncbi:1-acyl-sn-glycerol-3-phosphate acyltransferase [Sphingomonas sp. ABOLD]|uniref:lysophospholipid acyltransferase family protein n=1 Tax=Sphingomonas TaxID=13687 RepID=UPI000F7EC871|nr:MULTISPECIES: lysophospholipid acyltransferase family protein [Sphingomonas]RSV32902.1 1-acyl-sn-glycerol-3-phosphate acyltransferase [Sphingomonas sp. ABOLE]RSV36719.1 1-acyl-sn-glycerol-3-phosphate acyltransferase [Sphingomonas sp. ABOLD]
MDAVRTVLFRIFFYGVSIILVLCVPFAALFGGRFLRAYSNFWAWTMQWSLHAIVGARLRIEGTVPEGQLLFAGKHESYFEALELTRILHSPATVMKRELASIPLWGWAAQRYGTIVVDREANATALRSMMRAAQAARASGRSVLIFPEGTRVLPGEAPPLRSGFAGLYRALDLPVVPVAVRSGSVWPRKGLMRPGEIVFRFGEPIPPGLPRREIEARVHAAINALNG